MTGLGKKFFHHSPLLIPVCLHPLHHRFLIDWKIVYLDWFLDPLLEATNQIGSPFHLLKDTLPDTLTFMLLMSKDSTSVAENRKSLIFDINPPLVNIFNWKHLSSHQWFCNVNIYPHMTKRAPHLSTLRNIN